MIRVPWSEFHDPWSRMIMIIVKVAYDNDRRMIAYDNDKHKVAYDDHMRCNMSSFVCVMLCHALLCHALLCHAYVKLCLCHAVSCSVKHNWQVLNTNPKVISKRGGRAGAFDINLSNTGSGFPLVPTALLVASKAKGRQPPSRVQSRTKTRNWVVANSIPILVADCAIAHCVHRALIKTGARESSGLQPAYSLSLPPCVYAGACQIGMHAC
jgi:hypothetical protein